MSFANVIGQEAAINVLRRSLAAQRVPQAYLFIGPPNVGKTLVAVEFAKAANCTSPPGPLPTLVDERLGEGENGTAPAAQALGLFDEVEAKAVAPAAPQALGLFDEVEEEPPPPRPEAKDGLLPPTPLPRRDEENVADLRTGLPDACDVCHNCVRIGRLAHPDFRLVRPLVKIQTESTEGEADVTQIEGAMITTDQVADLIADANLKISQARRKVYVIVGAEAMNVTAANRLLKTLEEPPGATTFVLTTANVSALLPTIISRCQALHFRPVPTDLAVPFLSARYPDVDLGVVKSVAAFSGGRIGWADHLLAHPGVLAVRDGLLEMAASLPQRQPGEAMVLGETLLTFAEHWWLATEEGDVAEKLLKGNRDRVLRTKMNDLLDVIVTWFRDLALISSHGEERLVINADRAEQLQRAAKAYTPSHCGQVCEELEAIKTQLRGNANLRLAAEITMLKLIGASR
jgi:DNA polymerase III subunit delta'